MRLPRSALALLLGVLGPALSSARGAGFGLFRNYWGDVIVSTDTTREGRALTPPAPDNPVYYLGRSLGRKLGSIPGDVEPDVHAMNQLIARILAKQGYLAARPGVHEPTLFLVVQWGYLEPQSGDLMWFLGYDPGQDIAAPSPSGFLGAEVFRRNMRSRTTETILEYAGEPNYGIIVTAFEYQSANTPKPVIYWQTRIALPANGKSMTEALPTMLLAAAPAIGRESKSPVLRDADDVREGQVKLGELQFLDVISEPAHGTDSGAKK